MYKLNVQHHSTKTRGEVNGVRVNIVIPRATIEK